MKRHASGRRAPSSYRLYLTCAGLAAPLVAACSGTTLESATEHGRMLFEGRSLSGSSLNQFSCRTCHDATQPAGDGARKPGAPLAGATLRPSFWGGQVGDLLQAVNDCRRHFMQAPEPLVASDPRAEALYAYLRSLEPGDAEAQPFTVVRSVRAVSAGSADGEQLYSAACSSCHGARETGAGRLSGRIPILPGDTVAAHPGYDAASLRLVFVEKTRHGGFLGYGGNMPPFSLEVLPDAELGAILDLLAP